ATPCVVSDVHVSTQQPVECDTNVSHTERSVADGQRRHCHRPGDRSRQDLWLTLWWRWVQQRHGGGSAFIIIIIIIIIIIGYIAAINGGGNGDVDSAIGSTLDGETFL